MIVTSPHKKKAPKRNVRNSTSVKEKRTSNGTPNGINYGRRSDKKRKKNSISFPALKPWKVILSAFVIGSLGVLYLNHVFATQELLREVQQLEQEYNQAKRMNNDYRLDYDRMIGPAEIYDKARAMGLINGGPAEKVIEVEAE